MSRWNGPQDYEKVKSTSTPNDEAQDYSSRQKILHGESKVIRLLSLWSQEYKPLAEVTYPGKIAYAKKWDYECNYGTHLNVDKIAWDRPRHWLNTLMDIGENDWLWFTGCDVLITNPKIDISIHCDNHFDAIFSNDCNCIQSDSFLIKNNIRSRSFLKKVIDSEGWNRFSNEQEAMNVVLSPFKHYIDFYHHVGFKYGSVELHCRLQEAVNHTDLKVKLVSQKCFNAYDMKKHRSYSDGRQWPPTDGSNWEDGDLALHMASQSLHYRLRYLPEYQPNEYRLLSAKL